MITKKKNSKTSKFLEELAGELTLASLDFAKLLKISRQYLCDVEHGRRFVSPKAAADFAKKLGYSPQQFVRLCLQDLVDREGLKLKIDVKIAA